MSAPPEVTVAVVSWNTRELLRDCLRSLAPEVEAGRADVWVVDNASDDGSPELVREAFPWATLIASDKNLGFGRAVNLVAQRTTTRWIAPANADVALEPGAMEALLSTGDANPRAGIVAPRLVLPDGSTQHSVHSFPTLGVALAFNLGLARLLPPLGERLVLPGCWEERRARDVDWAIAAFMLVRRDAFDEVGRFDEAQWMYAEDLDLGWRMRRSGWGTRYTPEAAVRHVSSAAAQQAFGEDIVSRWMVASYAWMVRRRGVAYTWSVAAVNTAGAAARIPFSRGEARVAHRRWMRAHRTGLHRRRVLLGT